MVHPHLPYDILHPWKWQDHGELEVAMVSMAMLRIYRIIFWFGVYFFIRSALQEYSCHSTAHLLQTKTLTVSSKWDAKVNINTYFQQIMIVAINLKLKDIQWSLVFFKASTDFCFRGRCRALGGQKPSKWQTYELVVAGVWAMDKNLYWKLSADW